MFVYFLLNEICRDGVSESQFNQVLNIELNQIIEVSAPSSIAMRSPYNILVFWVNMSRQI